MYRKYHINSDWKKLASQIVSPKKRILVLGASDAGKTSFCKFLVDYACAATLKVALVDADIGQSQIGPPTTIGMKLFQSTQVGNSLQLPFGGFHSIQQNLDPDDRKEYDAHLTSHAELTQNADRLYFIGALSPIRNLLTVLSGTRLMVDAALEESTDVVIIDTTGYIHERAAIYLKQSKIDLIQPHYIVCIGRSNEFEQIVGSYRNFNWTTIHYLLPHRSTRAKSSPLRKRNRKNLFEQYFSHSTRQTIPFEQIRGARTPFFNGRIANLKELEILAGLTETEILYAEWGHRSLCLIARRKIPHATSNHLKNYLSLSTVSYERPTYFEQRLVGMLDETGNTITIGIIENTDFDKKEFHIRCKSEIAVKTKVLQFGDYQFTDKK